MHSRAIPFPPVAERAFGSRKTHATFPDGARNAFSHSDRATHAFGKKSTEPSFASSSASASSAPLRTVQITDDMFPTLSASASQKPATATTSKLSFADLMRKRALEDEAEKERAGAIAEARAEECRRAERDRAHLKVVSNIRTTFQKSRVHEEEEEEFYDEGEAYVRPEDMEPAEDEDAYST